MDLIKHLEYFNPLEIDDNVHVIGLGAIGSHLCEALTRLGFKCLHIYDFDTVTDHNLANQNYDYDDVKQRKTDATEKHCKAINPRIKIIKHDKGWTSGTLLNGYVFLAVDSITVRQNIVTDNMYNPYVLAMFDHRMRFEDAQSYAADWTDFNAKHNLFESMNFTEADAKAQTPVSACGTTLSILPTINIIVNYSIANMINLIKTQKYKKVILINSFGMDIVAM